ncbi:hypothetical protein [Nonomuraea sp. 10N515B]
MLDLRLAAYGPHAGRLGVLPTPLSVEIACPFLDVLALKLSYNTRP